MVKVEDDALDPGEIVEGLKTQLSQRAQHRKA